MCEYDYVCMCVCATVCVTGMRICDCVFLQAIAADSSQIVYFSNRSASYAAYGNLRVRGKGQGARGKGKEYVRVW